jgi:elongation factor P hydroxylase
MRIAVVLAGAIVLGSSLGGAALATGPAPSFAPARSYAGGGVSVAIGDLNGDSKADLATATGGYYGSDNVSVLLNRGDGSFQAKLDYAAGDQPFSIAIGDLNGDGKADLATANTGYGWDSVSVLLNRGDGSFQAKVDYATGGSPRSVAIDDLNGDGKPDLATANSYLDNVSVLLNSGDGSFPAKRDYRSVVPISIAIGDLNGDGKPDLATANSYLDNVSVLLNSGDGSFPAKRDYRTSLGPNSVAIGDLNADGKPDLATANAGYGSHSGGIDAVNVLLNKGDGSFRFTHVYQTGRSPHSVAIGDLNGDRKPDLATANRGKTVSVLVNRGDGSFQAKLDYAAGYPNSVAIGDLNGDGEPDLATAGGTVSVLINTPGLCTVQDVFRQTLPAAKRTLARVNCRVGKIRRVYSKWARRGRVISQTPRRGTVLPNRGKVNLVVSRGRTPS